MTIDPRYRTFWRRFWAGNVDWLVLLPLVAIEELVAKPHGGFVAASWFIVNQLAFIVYSISLHGLFGQTLGKMVFRIKVIDASEERPIAFRQAFLRDSPVALFGAAYVALHLPSVFQGYDPYAGEPEPAVVVVAAANGLWFFLEFATMPFNPRRRAAHDFLARSVVVREGLAPARPPTESAA